MVRLRKRWKVSRIVFWALSNDFNINISSSWYISSFPSLKIREKSFESSFMSLLNSEIFSFIFSPKSKSLHQNKNELLPEDIRDGSNCMVKYVFYPPLMIKTHPNYLNLLTNYLSLLTCNCLQLFHFL